MNRNEISSKKSQIDSKDITISKQNCKYALPLKDRKTGKRYRCCTIAGEKSMEACYVNGDFVGNLCKVYDKDICKDKKVRSINSELGILGEV